jgi:hypothetical protein
LTVERSLSSKVVRQQRRGNQASWIAGEVIGQQVADYRVTLAPLLERLSK